MLIYLLPLLTFGIGWLFFFGILKFYFSKNKNTKYNFLGSVDSQKEDLAFKIGALVQTKFQDSDILQSKIGDPALMDAIRPGMEKYLSYFIENNLIKKYPIITMMGGDDIVGKIKTNLLTELDIVLPQIISKYASTLQEKVALNEMVKNEIMKLNTIDLQEFILKKAKKIFQIIPLLGGILGLLIGLVSIYVFMEIY